MIKKRVVITGMGSVAPNGHNTQDFWRELLLGHSYVDTIRLFDSSPFPTQIDAEVTGLNFEDFYPKNKLSDVSRVVPISLAAARECMATSGLLHDQSYNENIGVIVGTAAHGLGYFENQARILYSEGYKKVTPHCCTGTFVGMLSSEIAMVYDLHGPSQVISTGCTSALDSMGSAFNFIRFGLSDIIITGGGESCISPLVLGGFSRMNALSRRNQDPQKASRPFDRERDGFVIGEGAWIFAFEELEHAKKRGATICAEVVGYGSTSDAYHKTSPSPTGRDLQRAMEIALNDGEVNKSEIDYISPHGTSTPLNDKFETLAIKNCFGERAYSIPMSSPKSMIGHSQGASGACGVAVAVQTMHTSVMAPTINLENPDPDCDLDYVPNVCREKRVDTCLVTSVAFGSRNSAMVVKKYA